VALFVGLKAHEEGAVVVVIIEASPESREALLAIQELLVDPFTVLRRSHHRPRNEGLCVRSEAA
jgi:hypothetical protein